MILEQATFAIAPGSEADFEAAIGEAKEVIAQAQGLRSCWRELIGPYFAAPPEVEHFEAPIAVR